MTCGQNRPRKDARKCACVCDSVQAINMGARKQQSCNEKKTFRRFLHVSMYINQLLPQATYAREKNRKTTRLPSNLRPTTRKCVYLVRRGHYGSRDNDGGHTTIRFTIANNPMLHASLRLYLL